MPCLYIIYMPTQILWQNVQYVYNVYCFLLLVGTYGDKKARRFDMVVTKIILGGSFIERRKDDSKDSSEALNEYSQHMQNPFKFVQAADGSVPAVIHSKDEDPEVVNIKKAIASTFQANFEGSREKVESDPQSLHVSEYT